MVWPAGTFTTLKGPSCIQVGLRRVLHGSSIVLEGQPTRVRRSTRGRPGLASRGHKLWAHQRPQEARLSPCRPHCPGSQRLNSFGGRHTCRRLLAGGGNVCGSCVGRNLRDPARNILLSSGSGGPLRRIAGCLAHRWSAWLGTLWLEVFMVDQDDLARLLCCHDRGFFSLHHYRVLTTIFWARQG